MPGKDGLIQPNFAFEPVIAAVIAALPRTRAGFRIASGKREAAG